MELAGNSRRRGNRDRISALKDEELHPIMSFLTAKEAVQTCILSKRWKCLWTTLPFLNFTFDPGDDVERFINFVNTTLLLRGPAEVQTFRLSLEHFPWSHSNYIGALRSWILYVLRHAPKKFDIRAPSRHDLRVPSEELPMGVFTCSSLEDVSLFSVWFPYAGVIELPCLKRLHFRDICVGQDFVDKLFCGCPVLESLYLDQCLLEFSTIISQSLKDLILFTDCEEWGNTEKTLELIDAPNLLSFYYGDCSNQFEHRTVLHSPSLTDAMLCFNGCCLNEFNNGKTNRLVGISNIQNLKLMGDYIEVILENELLGCQEFPNLRDLFVDELCLSCHFNLLASFIDHIPNLEKISLVHHGCDCKMSKEHGNRESLKILPFQCKQLKTVEVQFCKNDEDFPSVFKYLQKSVLNLEVEIRTTSFSLENRHSLENWRSAVCQQRINRRGQLIGLDGRRQEEAG